VQKLDDIVITVTIQLS